MLTETASPVTQIPSFNPKRWRIILPIGFLVFILAHWTALSYRIEPGISLWYPPAGVAIAFTLCFGLVGVPLTIVSSMIMAPFWGHSGWSILLGITDGIEPTIAFLLYHYYWRGSLSLKGVKNAIAFLLSAPFLACFSSAIVGCFLLASLGVISWGELNRNIPQWWLGNAIGTLAIVPLFLLWVVPHLYERGWFPQHIIKRDYALANSQPVSSFSRANWKEIFCLVLTGISASILVTKYAPNAGLVFEELAVLSFLPVLWAAVRFGAKGGAAIAALCVVITLLNYKIFYAQPPVPIGFSVHTDVLYVHQLNLLLQAGIALLLGTAIAAQAAAQNALASERIRLIEYQTRLHFTQSLTEVNQRLEKAVRELQKNEERFRTSVENMLDCFGIYSSIRDESGKIIDFYIEYVNEAACQNNRLPKEAQVGKRLCEVLPPFRTSGLFSDYCQVVETGKPLVKEALVAIEPDPEWKRAFDIRVVKFGDGFIVTWREITDRKRAEEELYRHQQEFKVLVENSPDIIARFDHYLRHLYVNPAIATLTGFPPDWFIGKTYTDLNMPEAWQTQLQEIFTTKQERTREFTLKDGEGNLRYYHARIVPEFAYDGSVSSVLSIAREITNLKQAEAALRQSEYLSRSVLRNFPKGAVFLFDTQLCYTLAEGEGLALVGLQPEDVEGKNIWEALPLEIAQQLEPLHQQVLAGKSSSQEFFYANHLFYVQALPIRNDQGEITSGMVMAQDITELKQALAALQDSEERLRLALEVAKLGTWCYDIPKKSVICSWRTQVILGLEPTVGEYEYGLLNQFVHPEDRHIIDEAIATAITDHDDYIAEYRLIYSDGSIHWIAATGRALYDLEGQPTRMIGVVMDITERKQIEAERTQALAREQAARQQAESASRLKDEFLAIVSHELRSPLNAMLGWSQLLRSRKLDEATTHKALEAIERNAKAQNQLIEDLLDISRIIRGNIRLYLRPINPARVVEQALDTVRPSITNKQIQLTLNLNPDLSVSGDPDRLQQVSWNLLSNAVKFTPEAGKITVTLQKRENWMELQVTDSGIGISSEFLPYVFDRFRQADGTVSRSQGGLGLGLAIVRNLVELHGGRVRADSPGEGLGATFTVELPLIQAELEASGDEDLATPSSTSPLAGLRILIVDDEPDTREFLIAAMEQYGASVIPTASAMEAIQLLPQIQVDLLLSDIGMPIEDGYALIRRIRALPPHQGGQIPAAALTAYAREEDRLLALAAGFQMHVPKPIDPGRLLRVVVALTGRSYG